MSLKAIVLGEANSGKTSICAEFASGGIGTGRSSLPPQPTIGTSFVALNIGGDDGNGDGDNDNNNNNNDNNNGVLNVWDTAGAELYRSIVPLYYRNVEVAVLVFDITNEPSFEKLDFWFRSFTNFYRNTPRCPPIVLVGNKCDLHADRQISRYQAEAWMRDRCVTNDANDVTDATAANIVAYIETSTRTPTTGIVSLLNVIIEHATLERKAQAQVQQTTKQRVKANATARFDTDDLDDDPSRVVVLTSRDDNNSSKTPNTRCC